MAAVNGLASLCLFGARSCVWMCCVTPKGFVTWSGPQEGMPFLEKNAAEDDAPATAWSGVLCVP